MIISSQDGITNNMMKHLSRQHGLNYQECHSFCKSCDYSKMSIVSYYTLSFISLSLKSHSIGNIFCCLDDTLHYSAEHGCKQEICIKATEINMEKSECDIKQGISEQKDKDKTRSSYLKERLLLTHERGLGMKSLTRTTKCSV